jgi:Xaa-Pro aminopeptidase
MIKRRIEILKKSFQKFNIDGYVIPKNDEFFSEHSNKDRLKVISNFSGSAGYAIILKKKNYLFVDGRYTLQAELESGNNFKIVDYKKIINCNLFKKLILGIDPKLFTSSQIEKFFLNGNKVKEIPHNLVDNIYKNHSNNPRPFFSLDDDIVGENYKKKINKVINFLKKNKLNYIFITAPENIAWLLNIRGYDNPNSPIPNCHLMLDAKKNIYLIGNKRKFSRLITEKKVKSKNILSPNNFSKFIKTFGKKKISIDSNSCSVFFENILKHNLRLVKKEDPIYLLKSIKNKVEIKNMIDCHVSDGVALTKFLYWMKEKNKKKITEYQAQNKLESFRKRNKNYLFPSFNTIAGAGGNGAIVHYRATRQNAKIINKEDLFLCDSGGQYKYGTTDVTRTISFKKPKKNIKNIFTNVLKGHIAVATSNIDSLKTGKLIDVQARKYLKRIKLDYQHGTGHGVGFFLNVHEGPQSLSKYSNVKILKGMIISNEPGYYKKGKFGIRIENLLYVKETNKKTLFENLTLAPIDKDLIDFKKLTLDEKNYLFKYHMRIYSELSKYLSYDEKKWLASFI